MKAPCERDRPTFVSQLLRRRAALGGLIGALAAPSSIRAQPGADWPRQPVLYINAFPAGGATDTFARLYCAKMGEIAGQPFLVENRSGSGGVVGAEAVAKARPDGYTIGMGGITALAIAPTLHAKLPYDAARDFSLICGQWRAPILLVANNDLPARSVPELIDLLKANPGKYAYASSGTGNMLHLAGELLKRAAGVDMLHVPYRGGALALLDLMGGRVNMQFDVINGPLAAVRDGKVRALAVLGPRRSPVLPDVPAMAEFLPAFEIGAWGIVCGPAGLPRPVAERLSALSKRALESPDLVRGYRDIGAEAWWTTPDEIATFRAAEEARLAPLVRASGARVD